jgi:hypothetical protein
MLKSSSSENFCGGPAEAARFARNDAMLVCAAAQNLDERARSDISLLSQYFFFFFFLILLLYLHTMQANQLSLLFQLAAQYSTLIVPSLHLSLSSLRPYHHFTEASFFTIRFSCLPFVEGLRVGMLCIGMCFLTMKLKCREISRLDMRARAGVALLGSGFLMLDGTHVHHFFQD